MTSRPSTHNNYGYADFRTLYANVSLNQKIAAFAADSSGVVFTSHTKSHNCPMYHYKESGLPNVWLKNGYTIRRTKHGEGVSFHNVEGLHKAIGRVLANKLFLTGSEVRFLRKELDMSQSSLAAMLGTSEQNISLWERRGKVPKASDRLLRLIYLEHIGNNQTIVGLINRLNALDNDAHEKINLEEKAGKWKEAA